MSFIEFYSELKQEFKEFAVGTQYETHTLTGGYFTAKIRKGKFVYYIDLADDCPCDIARIPLPKEPLTAANLGQAKYKVAQIYKEFLEANAKKQAELGAVWDEMNKQAREKACESNKEKNDFRNYC